MTHAQKQLLAVGCNFRLSKAAYFDDKTTTFDAIFFLKRQKICDKPRQFLMILELMSVTRCTTYDA